MQVLFMAHRAPFPPNRGDRLRTWNTVRRLAELGDVDVVSQADSPADEAAAREGLAGVAREVHVFSRAVPTALLQVGLAAAAGGSMTAAWHRDARVERALDDLAERHDHDVAWAFSSGTGPWLRRARARRKVMDLCDLDALKWARMGRDGHSPRAWVQRLEAERLLPLELRLAEEADLCVVSTRREADDLCARAAPRRLAVVTQGASWRDLAGLPAPSLAGPVLGFLGQMDYAPNVRAVGELARVVLPCVRERLPAAELRILGREPAPEVRGLASLPGVLVTGEVSSVPEALAGVAVFCAPIDRGRGIPTKVVEALAAGRAVVLSRWAAGALQGEPGTHYLVADDAAQMGRLAADLLADPARLDGLAAAGQAYVREHHDWDGLMDRVAELVTALTEEPVVA